METPGTSRDAYSPNHLIDVASCAAACHEHVQRSCDLHRVEPARRGHLPRRFTKSRRCPQLWQERRNDGGASAECIQLMVTAWAFATANQVHPGRTGARLLSHQSFTAQEAERRMTEFNAQELASSTWAFAKMNKLSDELLTLLA